MQIQVMCKGIPVKCRAIYSDSKTDCSACYQILHDLSKKAMYQVKSQLIGSLREFADTGRSSSERAGPVARQGFCMKEDLIRALWMQSG